MEPRKVVVARGFHPRVGGPERAALRLLGVFVVAFVFSAAQPTSSGNAENGKRVFATHYCYACHGTEGQGGAGPRLVARATPDALIRYVRKPTGVITAYTSKSMSDQDLRDIHAYLRSIPPSPSAKTIPMLGW
jgi:mono/diheme cytochrome c family protein